MATQTEPSAVAINRPLNGQWAVVTGASKGIGLGIASGFVSAGANVVMIARGTEALTSACNELRQGAYSDQAIVPMVADTADRNAIDELFTSLRAELPFLNILVANAGSGRIVAFLDLTLDEWDQTLALNLTGTFLCCQRAAQMMTDGPADANKAILVVSSIRAIGVRPGRVAYSVTKAGVNQFVRSAAYELAPLGIRVNILSPGITATPLALEGNPAAFSEMAGMVPLGRAGTPADMSAAALYLCGPGARFVTGANVVVDGGESLW